MQTQVLLHLALTLQLILMTQVALVNFRHHSHTAAFDALVFNYQDTETLPSGPYSLHH